MRSINSEQIESDEAGLLPVFTFVLWSVCLVVGLLDSILSRSGPSPPVPAAPRTELLNVEVIPKDSLPASATAIRAQAVLPEPSSAIAFPKPADAPPRAVSAPATPVQRLNFGEGEGLQPAPEYPREAVLAGQEGTVDLLISVGTDGRIQSVQVIQSSSWPLLDQAAMRAVRETWRFHSGAERHYEIAIQFQLNRH